MNAVEFVRALAAATHDQADGLERGNIALADQISKVDQLASILSRIPMSRDLGGGGGAGGPATSGKRSGIARDTAQPPTSRTIQGPNGLETEILGPNGEVISVVPVGPQSVPNPGPFLAGPGAAPTDPRAAVPGSGASPAAPPIPGPGSSVAAPGVLPEGSQRAVTGSAGGKTVVAPLAALQKYCKITEYTVPDDSVPGASPTKGPWVRRTVYECPIVPGILPKGGVFMEEEKAPGGIGGGFAGLAQTTEGGTAGSFNPGPGGHSVGAHYAGSPSGYGPTGTPIYGASTAPPSPTPPAAPSPGDKLVAVTVDKLTSTIGRLAKAIERDNGNLSFRGQGFGG